MKKIKILSGIVIIAGLLLMNSCKERFMEITPNGSLDQTVLATYDGVDGLLIGAYSLLDGVTSSFGWQSATSGWVYGSIRALEANKGTDAGDQPDINPIQTFSETATNPYLNVKWRAVYEGIARCNSTIVTANKAKDAGTITDDEYNSFIAQARALRGFYHLEAWRLWADRTSGMYVPYVDENTDPKTVTNTEDIRDKIIEDLMAGTQLPNDMKQVGRFNKTVSEVFLAKAYMQMYNDYAKALPLLADAEVNGTNPAGQKAELDPLFGEIFDIEKRNGVESIYTVQYSVNDGSGGWNGGWGEVLNFPYKSGASPGGCCGFFQPTQDFVNTFRTDPNGLPYLDNSYNDEEVTNDEGLTPDDPFTPYAGRLDPRLDWTVGRRSIPFWDWGPMTGSDWIRDQSYAGPYVGKKQVYKKSQEGTYTEVGNWTSGWTANGYRMIRYADVLLLKAECEAMLNQDDRGMGEVNAVRQRAANPEGFVKNPDGTNAANYVIGLYPSSQFDNTADAMTAIRFERRLELGLEGHRYYDMQRWNGQNGYDMVAELNRILNHEKSMPWGAALYQDATVGPEDVNFPIPQRQIDLSNGNLVQNR
ncbi:MAG: RagB/SusD family nutrient uptake outer membrane protein [Bacteroidales bacterium]|nr:RagB/SusD family nutrient uptake outer membrane protein [Bacteroidales bacterium]